jgi:hypothetical protein
VRGLNLLEFGKYKDDLGHGILESRQQSMLNIMLVMGARYTRSCPRRIP